MRRRTALATLGTVVTAGVAGCTGGGAGETDTSTPTGVSTPTPPTATPSGPFLRYLVYNDDAETQPLEVTVATADGEVLQRRSAPEFASGDRLGATTSGYDPAAGPFDVTFALESVATTVEWAVDECPRLDLLVAVTADGPLEIERERCIE